MTHWHTPDDPRVFVFGSNRLGIHGKGAALYAREQLGAVQGKAEGLTGRAYALPTCARPGVPLERLQVWWHVRRFLECALSLPDVRFFVSEVGCGLGGFTPEDIGPMFRNAPSNCDLPPGWRAMMQPPMQPPIVRNRRRGHFAGAYDPSNPNHVYIGRPSKWGNPFSHTPDTLARHRVATREEAVAAYEAWLPQQPELMAALPELRGKTLWCWCAPQPCHGDVLARLANS